jgi:DNA mismatch repair protein MSH3
MVVNKRTQHTISHFFKPKPKNEPIAKIDLTSSCRPTAISKFSFKSNAQAPTEPDPKHTSVVVDRKRETVVSKGQVENGASVTKRKSTSAVSSTVKKPKTRKLTPLESQILQLKLENKDKLLVIQVGYKYKLFGEDAKIASKILNIMYISGSEDLDQQFAYCSFPDFKLHINLKRLLNHGHKIGVVKQMESAIVKEIEKSSKSSDVMRREVTAVYTKGTYMGDEFEEKEGVPDSENEPSYIVAIDEISATEFSMVAVQPLTGEIVYDTFEDTVNRDEMETRLLHLRATELIIICINNCPSIPTLKTLKRVNPEATWTTTNPTEDTITELTQFFANIDPQNETKFTHLIEYYTTTFSISGQRCISELIKYLAEFKLSNVFTLTENIVPFTNNNNYMILPGSTLQALDIFHVCDNPNQEKGTLTWLLDHTRTRFGKRKIRKWIAKPLVIQTKIEERLQAIDELSGSFNHLVDSMKNQLSKINIDLEELLIKVHYTATYKTNRINRKEVFLMLNCFNEVLNIVKLFELSIKTSPFKSPLLQGLFSELLEVAKTPLVSDLLELINPAFIMIDQKNFEDQVIQFFNPHNHKWPAITEQKNEIENIEHLLDVELTSVKSLLNRPQLKYITNNKEPYLIEVRNGKQVDNLPDNFQRINGTTTVSRFRTVEISRLYKLLQYHQELLINTCNDAFNQFLQKIDASYSTLEKLVSNLATFDCILSITAASVASSDYSRPHIVSEQIIEVSKGRNPIIETLRNVNHYVPNDINIRYDKDRVLVITGPNMGGKSSYVKQVALLVLMTQIGCYIPCESATMGIFDSIFIRMGASDDIVKGNSTFMNEMLECSQLIKRLSTKSLVILDEIGRGTGTTDGISIAYSILSFLIEVELKPLVLFITHYPFLHVLQEQHDGIVMNYHMGFEVIEKNGHPFPEVVFLYNLVAGPVNNLYGLNVAKLAGIPTDVISRAFTLSEELKTKIEIESVEKFTKKCIQTFRDLEKDGTLDTCLNRAQQLLQNL